MNYFYLIMKKDKEENKHQNFNSENINIEFNIILPLINIKYIYFI